MSVGSAPAVNQEQLIALLDHTSAVIYMRGLDGRYQEIDEDTIRVVTAFEVPEPGA